ncbi:SIS domain-containing protein [bacterium]|jgi:D-sedoheptulose 7-phosphate isomerase|nr:SIS domain-containing protein [bacterium]MBU1433509.1 SIS domain-containing protein [bacterium]MBU1503309.1 SIS domain-containing protein [bacterium]
MKEFSKFYTDSLINHINCIDHSVLDSIVKTLDRTIDTHAKIYIIGNGGSAATASHMANDLSIGLKLREIRSFDVESLSDNSSVCTAIANDIGYENIFYAQIKNKIKSDDVLIAISCSGNSQNIIKAVEYAKKMGTTIVGMTGFDGGKLKELADIKFHVATAKGEYGMVEDIHMILDHMIYSYYVSLKPETKTTYIME